VVLYAVEQGWESRREILHDFPVFSMLRVYTALKPLEAQGHI